MNEVTIVGLGEIGSEDKVSPLTGNLPMLRAYLTILATNHKNTLER